MTPKSAILGFIFGATVFVMIPHFLIRLNDMFNLITVDLLASKILGALLVFTAILGYPYCFNLFIKVGKGTPVPVEPAKRLIVSGIYQYTRNPIYLLFMIYTLGLFLFFGRILLLVYFGFAVTALNIYVIKFEEPVVKKRFGKDYLAYCQKVPRWI